MTLRQGNVLGEASPDNSRHGSPRYHDVSMDDYDLTARQTLARLLTAFGDEKPCKTTIYNRFAEFKRGRINVGDEFRDSRPSTDVKNKNINAASDAGPLFRVTGAGAGGTKNELVARGGSGGALALSRAPVGGSASPAPAPLPQPAPSPAPAALPPPALPPPPFRADTPHRQNGAHIPALDGHAATQIPARPLSAQRPKTPERPANNKLQPGARATADSPTPAPPAPPAPSPLFPSHPSAYQAHAATALPDYRHTNHETRNKPAVTETTPQAPLNLHSHHTQKPTLHIPNSGTAAHPSLLNHASHPQAHPLLCHDGRGVATVTQTNSSTPTTFTGLVDHRINHVNGVPHSTSPHNVPLSIPNSLPSQTLSHQSGRPLSPNAQTSRSYPTPSIGSSHVNSTVSSSIHSPSVTYQSQPSTLQKHSVSSLYTSRPSHHTQLNVSNHLTNHSAASITTQATTQHLSHSVNNHSSSHFSNHHPLNTSNSLTNHSILNHSGPSPTGLPHTHANSLPNYTHNLKHPILGLSPHPMSVSIPNTHISNNHIETIPQSTCAPTFTTPVTSSSSHSLMMAGMEPKSSPVISSELPMRTESPATTSTLSSNGYPPAGIYSGSTYPPLYAPYATSLQHSPYLPPAAASPRNSSDTRNSLSASPLVAPKTPKGVRPHTPGSTGAAGAVTHTQHVYSPRGHSPTRERDSYRCSSLSSLSRTSGSTPVSSVPPVVSSVPITAASLTSTAVITSLASLAPTLPVPPLAAPLPTPLAAPLATPLTTPLTGPLAAPLGPPLAPPLAAPTPTPAAPAATHLTHSLAPVPTVGSISSSAKPPAHWGVTRSASTDRATTYPPAPLFGAPLPPPNPNPFSAESLFQTSPGADLLRRELDNRFLAAAGAVGSAAGTFNVRTEMHHHQHQHTHVHQHPPPLPHPHPHAHPHPHHQLYVPPPPPPLFKDVGKMASLYRTGLGLGYPYSSSLLHPTAPYVPPAPLSYAPKPVVPTSSDATKPARPAHVKTGKWNAMHVRIAWEIYNHQQKEKNSGTSGGSATSAVSAVAAADKEKPRVFPAPPASYRSPYELPPAPYLPPHHTPLGVSPFSRYGAGAFHSAPPPPFGLSPYARDLALSSSLHGVHHAPSLATLHDAWRPGVAPRVPAPPHPHMPPTSVAAVEARREHEERERARREREERERRDKEERERRKQRERELERVRQRSPLRNGMPESGKEERKEPPRPPPPLPAYPTVGAAWDPYRAFDPLQHMRFSPLVEAAIRAEEDRAKMLSAYAHHPQLKANPLLHRPLAPHAPLPPLGPHAPLAPLAPHAPLAPLGPLAPLDLLKKEEPR
ncbi:Autism susceptibility gene 2 protein [Eumeta japonica]|uniref:Autism susceptibility gene 2 protein n=1 Tax=Eumeta variegata TaxID=151549 RepID=A0A4C1VJK4_EUMVA|nr:Autism susceptibility gene 2 protein [Eumeta japonica]